MNVYCNLLTLVLLFTLASCSSTSEYKTSQQYWAETEFDWSRVKEKINDKSCHSDGDRFFSCVEGINGLLGFEKNGWFIFSSQKGKEAKSVSPNFLKGYNFNNNIMWVKRSEKSRKIVSKLLSKNYKNSNQGYKNNWLKYHQSGKRLPFNQLINLSIEYLKNKKVINDKNERYYAGQTYNFYLEALLGPYTFLEPREQVHDMHWRPNKEIQGIGAVLWKDDLGFKVEKVILGGPAHKAGLLVNDIITFVKPSSDKKFEGLASVKIDQAVSLIKGQEGTTVALKIIRDKKKLNFNVARARVELPAIEHKIIDSNGKRFLHLKVHSFYRQMFCPKVEGILSDNKPYNGIILDLRDNSGGSISSAYCLAEFFLKDDSLIDKKIFLRKGLKWPNDILKEETKVADDEEDINTPLIVLVNKNSASASEIVASSLQDNGRAMIVGERTVGKGTGLIRKKRHEEAPYMEDVEDLYFYNADIFGIRPRGTKIDGDGITPDIYLKPYPNKTANTKTKWERRLDKFPWCYVMSPSNKKWKHTSDELARNSKIQSCLDSKKKKVIKSYNKKSKINSTDKPDFQLMQTMELFGCKV